MRVIYSQIVIPENAGFVNSSSSFSLDLPRTIIVNHQYKVIFTSDNVFYRVQGYLSHSLPYEWLDSLKRMQELEADILVPGHDSNPHYHSPSLHRPPGYYGHNRDKAKAEANPGKNPPD